MATLLESPGRTDEYHEKASFVADSNLDSVTSIPTAMVFVELCKGLSPNRFTLVTVSKS